MQRLLMGLLLLTSFSSQAYVGSVSAATGETGRAAVEASESPFGNPAALAFLNGYYFGAGYGASHQNRAGNAQDLSVSLTDNMKDTVVPTSFSYVQNTSRPEGVSDDVMGRTFKLSFGNFIRPGFAFGLGINHQDDRPPQDHYIQTNVQTGVLWAPNKDFGAALTFENLVPPNTDIPEAFRLKQTTGAGVSYNFKRFVRLKGDLVSASNNNFGKPTLAFGMESYMNRWMILRWGLQRQNELDANLYTAGIGFIGPKFGFHYAYENSPQNESLSRHSVDLAVPIW
jgi:hypothetical protein